MMKRLIILLLFIPVFAQGQVKTPLGSQKDSSTVNGCTYLQLKKVELGIDEIGLLSSPDTVSALTITIKNTCKNCTQGGPDYTALIVRDEGGKVIAQVAINGIPQNGKSRFYYVPCLLYLKALPANLKISLVHYCMDVKGKQ